MTPTRTVPVEPTRDMLGAGLRCYYDKPPPSKDNGELRPDEALMRALYRAMLAAAPATPTPAPDAGEMGVTDAMVNANEKGG